MIPPRDHNLSLGARSEARTLMLLKDKVKGARKKTGMTLGLSMDENLGLSTASRLSLKVPSG